MKIPTVAKTWADHELVSPLLLNYINQMGNDTYCCKLQFRLPFYFTLGDATLSLNEQQRESR